MLEEFPIKIFDFCLGNLNSSLLNFSLKTDNKKAANVPMNALAASKPPAASLQVRAMLTKAVNREVKLSRRYRDRDFPKFESSRRYRER